MFNSKDKKELEELSNSSNTIGKGTSIEGDLESYGNIRLDGKVVGNIKTKSKIVMGESSYLEGNLVAANAEVSGEIKGTVEVAEILLLKPTAVINGDIKTGRLIVESGAVWNGTVKMGAVVKDIQIGKEAGSKERTA